MPSILRKSREVEQTERRSAVRLVGAVVAAAVVSGGIYASTLVFTNSNSPLATRTATQNANRGDASASTSGSNNQGTASTQTGTSTSPSSSTQATGTAKLNLSQLQSQLAGAQHMLQNLNTSLPRAEQQLNRAESSISTVESEIPQTGNDVAGAIKFATVVLGGVISGATVLLLSAQRKGNKNSSTVLALMRDVNTGKDAPEGKEAKGSCDGS